jgi:hypothetical protein
MLGRSYKDVMSMTLGEILSQVALHIYYTTGQELKGTKTLSDIFY